jgi:hypothetical protein
MGSGISSFYNIDFFNVKVWRMSPGSISISVIGDGFGK